QCHVQPGEHILPTQRSLRLLNAPLSGTGGCWECVVGAGSSWLHPSPCFSFQHSPGFIFLLQTSQ
ncbi:Uncharacterized protein DAT39_003463, partial [Clarias magur]